MSNANPPSAQIASAAQGNRGIALLGLAALIGTGLGAASLAEAQSGPAPAAAPAPAPKSDSSLTWNGITLYGTIDIGVQYEQHGAPLSDYFPAGTEAIIQKNSTRSVFTANESNLSQSKIGLQGKEDIGNGWSAVFKLESFFNPLSGNFSDALKSLTQANGKSVLTQNTAVDSSVAGQLFAGAAFGGISHAKYGTLTIGRHTTLLADGIGKYDPMAASQAFSLIGFSGTTAGGGNTEDRRYDKSLKYLVQIDKIRLGAMYEFNGASGTDGTAFQVQVGANIAAGSIDAFALKKKQSVSAGALSAGQVTTLNCPFVAAATFSAPCTGTTVGGGGVALDKALSASISDNTAFGLMGLYNFGPARVFAGYEHIKYANPDTPVAAGSQTIGGYTLAYVNNAPFPNDKILQVYWVGVKYTFSKQFDLTGAFYGYHQNSYASGANAGCSSNVSGQCSGTETALSVMGDYHLSKRFDVYAGAMYTEVKDGLSNGYLNTSTIDPTVGVRYSF